MSSTKCNKKPEPGDLIQIFRSVYQHWAIYVGEGYVIHLAPPSEHAQAGASSLMSVLCDKAIVKKDELCEVVGNDEYTINNILDEEYEPRPIQDVLRDAHSRLGKELSYSIFNKNCEHFVTELRYGKPESRQVQELVIGGAATLAAVVAVVAAASVVLDSKDKKKQKQ